MSAILAFLVAGQLARPDLPRQATLVEPVQYVQDSRGNLRGEGRQFGRGYEVERSRRSGTTT